MPSLLDRRLAYTAVGRDASWIRIFRIFRSPLQFPRQPVKTLIEAFRKMRYGARREASTLCTLELGRESAMVTKQAMGRALAWMALCSLSMALGLGCVRERGP